MICAKVQKQFHLKIPVCQCNNMGELDNFQKLWKEKLGTDLSYHQRSERVISKYNSREILRTPPVFLMVPILVLSI